MKSTLRLYTRKSKVLRCSLKTPPRHAHRSIIKDYFFNCFSFWQIKNIYVNSALTSQFWYVLPNVGIIILHNSPEAVICLVVLLPVQTGTK